MSLYVMADTHLSTTANKPMDVFGSRWTDYTSKIVSAWSKIITDDDTVVINGDISWAMSPEEAKSDLLLLDGLPGRKLISRGNHDYWWQTSKKLHEFFASCGISTMELLHNNAHIVDDKIVCGTRGWFFDGKSSPDGADFEKISARELGRAEMSLKCGVELDCGKGREKLMFFHFPPVFGDYVFREMVELLKKYGVKRCYYGHIHGVYNIPRTIEFEGISFTIVSSDYLNFVPMIIV